MLGGFKAQGTLGGEGPRHCSYDARALEAAGCFSLVLEAVPALVAARITRELGDPDDRDRGRGRTATARCSSGTTSSGSTTARARALREAVRRDRRHDPGRAHRPTPHDVRQRRFPEEQHTYSMPDDELALFEATTSDHQEHAEDRR